VKLVSFGGAFFILPGERGVVAKEGLWMVVKQMLYGKNPDAFEKEVFEGLHTGAKEHEVWRRRGSVGKWHNFAVVGGSVPVFICYTQKVLGGEQIGYVDRYAQEGTGCREPTL
jgi:hypothetical protein